MKRRSESDLLVFISSQQGAEMEQARRNAEKAIDCFPNCGVWAFENMPASSETARAYYLRNAAKADFVIWLAGRETPQAVVDEVHKCMSVRGDLLAFLLPADIRDGSTERLIKDVQGYAKWCEVKDLGDLASDIKASLSDAINHLVRNPGPPGREHGLDQLRIESIARCKQSLKTLNVTDDIADDIAQDPSVGYRLLLPTTGLTVVAGSQGVGKTLAVERLFQNAIKDALDDYSKPVPLFVRARDINRPLREYVEGVIQEYAFPSIQGALIVIDGLDEVGTANANTLLNDAIPYLYANPHVTAVVTTRLLPGLQYEGQRIDVPALNEQGALQLLSKVTGRTVKLNELRSWALSLQDAAKYPLFAIMIGAELRGDSHIAGTRPSDLLDLVVRRALRNAGDQEDEVDDLLQDLAVKTVSSGESIAYSDVHHKRTVRNRLIDSRLVSEESERIDFALPIFREWFAARAFVEGRVTLDQIQPIKDRWIFPIAIALNSENKDLGRLLIATLARSDPGLASLVLEEVGSSWFATDAVGELPAETDLEIGQEIRRAMEDWGIGLGALMPAIGPVTHDGNISTLGIELNSRMVCTAWYSGIEQLNPVVKLPEHTDPFSGQYDPDWSRWSDRTIPPIRDWPWVITKDMLVDSLSEQIGSRRLALQSTDTMREITFDFARSVTAKGITAPLRVNVSEVLRYIDEAAAKYASLHVGGSLYLAEDIQLIRQHLVQLQADGEVFISEPWPGPNKVRPMDRSSWRWHETFTKQQLLERTKAVYAAALRIYTSIVDIWFPAFGNRLQLKCILPVRLEGRLFIPNPPSRGREGPYLTWWPRPLGEHEESQVAFELGSRDPASNDSTRLAIEAARQESLNRVDGFWHSTERLHVDGPGPATELAHRWLINELREIGWTDLLS